MYRKIINWLVIAYASIKFAVGMSLVRAEELVFGDIGDLSEKNKRIQRMRHRNETLEKFYAGKRDEKYVQQFYEILKGADKFINNATPFKYEAVADNHSMSYGKRDRAGRVNEHYGFYDAKSKNSGKTVAEVIKDEIEERRTKDDNFPVLDIFTNKPIEAGLVGALRGNEQHKDYNPLDAVINMEFPIKATSEVERVNKIEKLTEVLYVKEREYQVSVQLEFYIPVKYGTSLFGEDSKIFKELISISNVTITGKYGEKHSFVINKFLKRISHNEQFDVFKFEAFVMKDLGIALY